jgi:glycosyltransferase involved in cell wall biosynthesis
MRVLLITPDLSYTGAPIALLQLARVLKALGHVTALAAPHGGPLGDAFAAAGIPPGDPNGLDRYDLYVANTVVSVPWALRFARSADQILAWIHESRAFFEVFGRGPETFGLHRLRAAAFPSRFQIDEFAPFMPAAACIQLRNCVQQPSERASEPDDRYACVGRWEPRKGQDRLLALAQHLPARPRFVFVGADRPPDVPDEDFYLGEVPREVALQTVGRARGLVSAARAETQNLSAIEAILAHRPVLLSDIPAHRELREALPELLLFDPENPASFVGGFAALEAQGRSPAALARLSDGAEAAFGAATFRRNVAALMARFFG